MDRTRVASEPLHARVAAQLQRDVRDGRYAPGQRLPSEVDLARLLNVSRGTVRLALTTLLTAGLLETIPGKGTFVTDGLSQRPAGLIGLILPSVVRARNPELISGVEATLREAGYSMILGSSGDERWLETEQLQRIVGQGALGAIVYTVDGPLGGAPDVPAIRRLVERGFPLVLIDRFIPDLPIDSVTTDNVGGGFLAVQHLVQQGHRRIGYIGTDNIGTSSIVERMAGYRWALSQYGLEYNADLVCTRLRRLLSWPPDEPEKQRHNEAVLSSYLSRQDRPTAAFICNDSVAFQVVQVADSLGVHIPGDLAVVGFDNIAYSNYLGVPLTTVEQLRHEIGTTAAGLLLDRLAGRRTQVSRVIVSTRLIVRGSSLASDRVQESVLV